jgi:hypothetical protein
MAVVGGGVGAWHHAIERQIGRFLRAASADAGQPYDNSFVSIHGFLFVGFEALCYTQFTFAA